jgi:glycerol-3-phosphate O-acyltransferase
MGTSLPPLESPGPAGTGWAEPCADWPDTEDTRRIVFLAEAASPLEARELRRWVERQRPEGRSLESIELIQLPSARRRSRVRGTRARTPAELEATLAVGDDPLMAPLRVVWQGAAGPSRKRARTLSLLAFGDPRDPGWLRQLWVRARRPERCVIVAGEPATSADLRARWTEAVGAEAAETSGFADFVAQKATLALERAERHIRGARYKVPRLVHEEILGRPSFRGGLSRIVETLRRGEQPSATLAALSQEAERDLKEIAATHSPFVIDLVIALIRRFYTLGYDEQIVYDAEQLKRVARLEEQHPVVFLPTHKHNLDHLVLQYVLHEHGLPPNHTAGGINMNFFPVGQLIRRSGVFFIRRSFRDDPLYKHVLAHYIDYLIEKRFPLEWYIEGGRSRSGKLLPPRYGLMANVVGAYRRGRSDDVYLVPVSIAYDQIQGLGSYVDEQKGGQKQAESFGWFLGVVRQMRRRYGRIHLALGEPLSLREHLGPPANADAGESGFDLEKLAFEVCVRINQVTPITPTSLATLALLGTTGQALTVTETRRSLGNLLENVRQRKLPTTAELDHLETDEGVRLTLDALTENGAVTRFDEGREPVYRISDEQQLSAAYYRNTIVHFFVSGAIAELALLHAIEGDRTELLPRFWEEVMRLRDLLKFEFFFSEKEIFREEVREALELVHRDWEKRVEEFELDPADMIQRMRPYFSHRVLRPFLESYRVVADQLARIAPGVEIDQKRLLNDCLGLGRQYALQKRIHAADSISEALFQTALRLADNRGLLERGDETLAEARRLFADEIGDTLRRVDIVVALAASRRAGFVG